MSWSESCRKPSGRKASDRAGVKFAAAVFCLLAQSAGAWAQSPTPAAPAESSAPVSAPAPVPGEGRAAPVVTEIVVTGERQTVETRVDRKVYAVAQDVNATVGSAADVLRNVPSVSIDLEGNPSLRGDASVQILIDGRPAPAYNNANRGAALEQLAAAGIDRIEVITNPPVNFKRDGSGGIINIITKRSSRPRTASARASVGSGGRFTLGTTQGAHVGEFKLNGSAMLRRVLRIRDITDRRVLSDAETGDVTFERDFDSSLENERIAASANLGADYEIDARNRLHLSGQFYRSDTDGWYEENSAILDAAGTPTQRTHRVRRAGNYEHGAEAEFRYQRDGETEGDGLTVSLQHSDEVERVPAVYTEDFYLPAAPTTAQRQRFDDEQAETELSIESVRNFASKAKLISGYELSYEQNEFDVTQTLAAIPGDPTVIDPDFTNQFQHRQAIHSLYASYERPFGGWTVLGGLRLEQVTIDLRQVTTGERGEQDYFRVYPSLHIARKLDEHQTLTFSYSKRVSRPYWQALNPIVIRNDAYGVRTGNPDLKPSEVDSLETGWSRERGQSSLSATLFARKTYDEMTFVTAPISPTMVLNRPENIGESVTGGLELSASGRMLPRVDYRLSGNLFYWKIDAGNLGYAGTRSTTSHQAKASLTFKASARIRTQLDLQTWGKQLTPQGYRRGNSALDAGFRYQWRPNVSLTATLSDVFETRRDQTILDTAEIEGSTRVAQPGRIAWLGFSWSLAAQPEKRTESFEYDR
jgi:outer membrane receptor protein involved in Fe transport